MDEIASVPAGVGQEIAQFRAEVAATQSQVAAKSGVDQSRVSRIEKGEIGSIGELKRVIDALEALGSATAKAYLAYLAKDWNYVERPDFRNPQRNIIEMAEETLRDINVFLTEEERPWPLKRQLERQRSAIEASAAYLGKTHHQIAFVGEVGVGQGQVAGGGRVQGVAGRVAGHIGGHVEHLLALGHGQLHTIAVQLAVPESQEGDEGGVDQDKAKNTGAIELESHRAGL